MERMINERIRELFVVKEVDERIFEIENRSAKRVYKGECVC